MCVNCIHSLIHFIYFYALLAHSSSSSETKPFLSSPSLPHSDRSPIDSNRIGFGSWGIAKILNHRRVCVFGALRTHPHHNRTPLVSPQKRRTEQARENLKQTFYYNALVEDRNFASAWTQPAKCDLIAGWCIMSMGVVPLITCLRIMRQTFEFASFFFIRVASNQRSLATRRTLRSTGQEECAPRLPWWQFDKLSPYAWWHSSDFAKYKVVIDSV